MLRLYCLLFVSFLSSTFAGVGIYVYESDGGKLFDNRRIHVGTELKFVIVSDANDYWSGGMFLSEQDIGEALLYSRSDESCLRYCPGCVLPAAGDDALAIAWNDTDIRGYDLYSSDANSIAGNWFEIDYLAKGPGDPNVCIYDYTVSWTDPNNVVTFNQVPRCDYDLDGRVDMSDFDTFSSYWGMHENSAYDCNLVDLDGNSILDLNDLVIFSSNWLWGTYSAGMSEPNDTQLVPAADPNLIYSIVDANGLSEITLAVGDTVTLYVDLETFGNSTSTFFDIEVLISDPNLGSIDNTAYDPNNPPGPGTARILADPNRWEFFDQWGPGIEQPEGIYFVALTNGTAIADGNLASFEFTCKGPGDVTLSLVNRMSLDTRRNEVYPTLRSILIHQPESSSTDATSSGSMMQAESIGSDLTMEESAMSADEMVETLEEIRQNDTQIQELITDDEWDKFIDEVKSVDPG